MHIYLQILVINLCSSFAYAIDYWQYGMSGLETVSKPKVTLKRIYFCGNSINLWPERQMLHI